MKVTLLLLLFLPHLFKFKSPLTRTSATARGHMNLLPLLISSGAHLDHAYIVTGNDKSKIIETCTALHLAVTAGQLDAVKLLVQSGSQAPTLTHVFVRLSVSVPFC